ncbi:hypothetical protein, partial [Citrobacter freundii]|uniref:hypothetical protein n=1 Tax=Citrobacter freundii TaxID=546 RepID=UPI002001B2A6
AVHGGDVVAAAGTTAQKQTQDVPSDLNSADDADDSTGGGQYNADGSLVLPKDDPSLAALRGDAVTTSGDAVATSDGTGSNVQGTGERAA